jgi:hypothetical protein
VPRDFFTTKVYAPGKILCLSLIPDRGWGGEGIPLTPVPSSFPVSPKAEKHIRPKGRATSKQVVKVAVRREEKARRIKSPGHWRKTCEGYSHKTQ